MRKIDRLDGHLITTDGNAVLLSLLIHHGCLLTVLELRLIEPGQPAVGGEEDRRTARTHATRSVGCPRVLAKLVFQEIATAVAAHVLLFMTWAEPANIDVGS